MNITCSNELQEDVVSYKVAQNRIEQRDTLLKEAYRLLDIALDNEGDIFGMSHNDLMDWQCQVEEFLDVNP